MPTWIRNSSLTIVTLALFALCLLGQATSGWMTGNEELALHGKPELGFGEYLGSAGFFEATFENWESEFLQMALFVYLSAHLVQKGSAESAKPREERNEAEERRKERVRTDSPLPVRRGGLWKRLYAHSLSLTLGILFLVSFVFHAISGRDAWNETLREHGAAPLSTLEFAASARFWFESLQNWQSEFLSVAAIVVLSIFLREKDSPESKPLAAPHSQTGTD
jgi:hypothetical protein